MKRILIILAALMAVLPAGAQGFKFIEATDLTIVGKVFPNTPDPYKRMDYTKYGGWVEKDINLLNMSGGIIVTFRTDAPAIRMRANLEGGRSGNRGERGFDLYIKKDGKW